MKLTVKIVHEIEVNISLQLETDRLTASHKLSTIKIGKNRYQRLDNFL